jgi:hypothetical protein
VSRKRKAPRRVAAPPPAGDGHVALHTLAPGTPFRTPDWPACASWPEALKGWEGRVVFHSVGSSTVARAGESGHLAVSRETRVRPTGPAPAPPPAPAPTP